MRLNNSRWTMVILGVIAFLVVGTMVWASPPAGAPSAPLQAYDANNAHMVDNHHAASSSATKAKRANRVLWANKKGQLHWRAMPAPALNKRYLNDDRQETISAAVSGGALLTVNNTGTGSNVRGLYAYGEDFGVWGSSSSGTGVWGSSSSSYGVYGGSTTGFGLYGYSSSGTGVWGTSSSGYGVFAVSTSGLALRAQGYSGTNLIEAWDAGAANLRFKVVRSSGNVYADGRYYCGQSTSCYNTGSGADIAERIDATDTLEPGDVVEIDPERAGQFRKAATPYSTLVAGIISTSPAMTMGNDYDGETEDWEDDRPLLALVGSVPVKASAINGAIEVGDLLTTSAIPGCAMRASESVPGTVLGKALEPLDEGTGVILVLVTLQ